MIVVKPLTESTLEDAETVVRSRFPPVACQILQKEMRNPLRRICKEVGDIAYYDGKPVCFQAFIARQMFFKTEMLFANVGGMTVLAPNAPVEALIDVRAASVKNRIGHKMGFGNTLCKATEKMAKRHKDKFGPVSCTCWRFKPIRLLSFFRYCFAMKVLKHPIPVWADFDTLKISKFEVRDKNYIVRRLLVFDGLFADFWRRYVEKNQGLVCSRTVEELNWIFGEEVKSGRAILLGYFTDNRLEGYVVLKCGSSACRRWQIIDWIALENDKAILDRLLAAGCKFLRKHTPAMLLESIGFPMYVQDVLKRHLPFSRAAGNNFFSYGYRKPKTEGKTFAENCEAVINTEKSWFFGPYDGDMCM